MTLSSGARLGPLEILAPLGARPGFVMKSFDVSPDGKQIIFDRHRENSDVVLIDLPRR